MNIGISAISGYVGMGFENICLLIMIVGGLIFYAKDFRLGVIMHFIGSGLLFLMFYALNMNYSTALILLFFWLTVLTLTLYFSAKTSSQGAIT